MRVEQFVMAYEVEQDRLRAILPEGFASLRPVLRINAEIRGDGAERAYLEFNTAVESNGTKGWLNITSWDGAPAGLSFSRKDAAVTFSAPFLSITYTGVGVAGGCPAEQDNGGCFFLGENAALRPVEMIRSNKEFCDCSFIWKFTDADARGVSLGKTLPAYSTEQVNVYPKQALTAQNAAAIPCKQVLGAYTVKFDR
jgi:hypothetical protein